MRRIYEPHAYGPGPVARRFWPAPAGHWPRLDGAARSEVAVIGAGITGLSAALHLAESGTEVTVLEARTPGWGASGRNGGFCCRGGAGLGQERIAARFGARAAADFEALQGEAIDLVAGLLERHRIEAETHSRGEVELAHSPRAFRALRARARNGARLIGPEELRTEGLAGPEFHGGLHHPAGFALNPGLYVGGLARAAQAAGARICAHSPVRRIERAAGGYRLITPAGSLAARRLILATNGYSADDLPDWLAGRYLPVQSNILVTRALSPAEQAAQGWTSDLMAYDSRSLLHYFRKLPDGRFLFGMRGGIRASPAAQARMEARTRRHFRRLFPAWRDVAVPFFWSGLVAMAWGRTPYAGPLGDWPDAWAGLAFHGNGVAMGTLTGKLLAGLARGERVAPGPVLSAPLARFPLGRARRALLYPAFALYGLGDRL